jgi:prevent-host-death family protein
MASNPLSATRSATEPVQINLYEAKTQLSSLVDRAAKGEEFVIAKAGKPMARLLPMPAEENAIKQLPFGRNLLGITFLSDDWEDDLPPEWFEGEDEDKLIPKDDK